LRSPSWPICRDRWPFDNFWQARAKSDDKVRSASVTAAPTRRSGTDR